MAYREIYKTLTYDEFVKVFRDNWRYSSTRRLCMYSKSPHLLRILLDINENLYHIDFDSSDDEDNILNILCVSNDTDHLFDIITYLIEHNMIQHRMIYGNSMFLIHLCRHNKNDNTVDRILNFLLENQMFIIFNKIVESYRQRKNHDKDLLRELEIICGRIDTNTDVKSASKLITN